jgi:hypothetical protein
MSIVNTLTIESNRQIKTNFDAFVMKGADAPLSWTSAIYLALLNSSFTCSKSPGSSASLAPIKARILAANIIPL